MRGRRVKTKITLEDVRRGLTVNVPRFLGRAAAPLSRRLKPRPTAWRRSVSMLSWNGASGIFFLLESQHRGVLGPIDLQGWAIDIGLLAVFLIEGAFMIWAVRRLALGPAAGAVVRYLESGPSP
jgi:hypothetical protein